VQIESRNDQGLFFTGEVLTPDLVWKRNKPLSLGSGKQGIIEKVVHFAGSPEGIATQSRGCRVGVGKLGRETFYGSIGILGLQSGSVGNMKPLKAGKAFSPEARSLAAAHRLKSSETSSN
jgi:hypothetical protein